ncbi:MAG: hypothetical protein MPF33_02395 [Candidatus Aramenus sp.]|jgi:hypothetical protein|nr:hypothetical protein [Candidatus Aramenus sp.]
MRFLYVILELMGLVMVIASLKTRGPISAFLGIVGFGLMVGTGVRYTWGEVKRIEREEKEGKENKDSS